MKWSEVKQRIIKHLGDLDDVQVFIYEPLLATIDLRSNSSSDIPKMTPGRAALVGLVQRHLAALMDPTITLLEVHKLMYFLQESGEKLRLSYVKGSYGPYAENLRHVLKAIEGHFLSGYLDGGDSPDKQLELVPGAIHEAEAFLAMNNTAQEHFDRVNNLVEGYETPFGLELLATVHWVVTKERALDPGSIESSIYNWGEHKRKFAPEQIQLAVEHLKSASWI